MPSEVLLKRERMPVARLEGTNREIGYAHGSLFAERVHRCWELYRAILGGDETDLQRRVEPFCEAISDYEPKYMEEMTGIAEGAKIEPWKIYVLNARTEIYRDKYRDKSSDECTSIYFRPTAVLGQNWDFDQRCESLTVLLEIRPEAGPAMLMMAEPGLIGKIGFNNCGVGVCLNILRCDRKLAGVPIHVLLRRALDSTSFAEALEAIDFDGVSSASNILLGDAEGRVVSIEYAGHERGRYSPEGNIVFHTNHYLELPIEDQKFKSASSLARCLRAAELAKSAERFDAEGMKQILLDKSDKRLPICREYVPDDDPGFLANGTNTTIIMELKRGVMHVTPGNPLRHPFETHGLS